AAGSTDSLHPWMHPSPLIIQHRARAVERARVTESFIRVSVLLAADFFILFVAHAIVDTARTSSAFSGALAAFLSDLIPRGSFPRVEVLTAVIIGLAVFGNYRGKSAWHNAINLLAGAFLGLSLVFWSRIWTDITLARVLGFVVVLAAVVVTLSSGRHLLYRLVEFVRPTPLKVSRAVILGSRSSADDLRDSDGLRLNEHLEVVGHVNTSGTVGDGSLGALSDLVWILERHSVDTIILADQLDEDALFDVLEVSERTGCSILLGSPMFPLAGFVPRVVTRGNIPYVTVTRPSLRLQQLFSKRAFDVVCASILLVTLAPVFAVIALTVRLTSKGPAFFRQARVGYGGKTFSMYKFRSMVKNAEELKETLQTQSIYSDTRLFKIPNDPRITPVGRFLRRSSLDELPQLWNVLRGEMSLVGPRPPLVNEVNTYEEHNYTRFDMKPGITGPWQVAGRNRITSFDEVVALETDYLTDWSLVKDFTILMKTVPTVLSMSGAV
ncbi:MAG TPA: sugar transferase, partial [Gemmatimonadaceae bacterium]|nr:sugar transferase [Gemmatimonadaceae bacterium]